MPYPWIKCVTLNNSPDIFPGTYWGMNFPASDESTYLNLVVRENGSSEKVFGKFEPALSTDSCYKISLDLARDSNFFISNFGDEYDFSNAAKLQIDFGDADCSAYIPFMSFENKTYNLWRSFKAIYKAPFPLSSIKLHAQFDTSFYYYGHILVDNIRIQKSGDTLSKSIKYVSAGSKHTIFCPEEENSYYEWTNLNCLNCSSVEIVVNNDSEFMGVRYDSTHCFSEKFYYKFLILPEVPNVLTSNDDNINDTFFIKGLREKSSLRILSRWGNIIYESNDYKNDWKAENLNDGTYFYFFSYEIQGVTYTSNGILTIL